NGAQAANVVWVVGSSWTSITPSTTVGNILAVTSITLGGGTLQGRALASAAITLAAAGTVVAAPPAAPPMAQTFTPVFAGSPAVASEFLTGYNATTGLFSAAQVSYSQVLGTPDLSVYALISSLSAYVPTTTTVNGHALSSNVVLVSSDLSDFATAVNSEIDTHIGVKNAANGFAGLDGSSHLTVVPTSTAPSNQYATAIAASGALSYSAVAVANLSDGTHVIVDTGSYADPSWITSLAGSKITGSISGNAASITGSITESQVTGLVTDLAAKPKLYDQYGDLVGAAGS